MSELDLDAASTSTSSTEELDPDAASTLTSSTDDLSISSEDTAVDIDIEYFLPKSATEMHTKNPEEPFDFRRCSLEHAKRYTEAKSPTADASKTTARPPPRRRCSLEHAKQYVEAKAPTTNASKTKASPPPQRRSSLKVGPSSVTKHVAFSQDVHDIEKIEFRDDAYFQAAWLSRSERAEVQEKAKADMRIVKHLKRNPDFASLPDMRHLRSHISIRGMEHSYSRYKLNHFKNEKESVICAVLEAQRRLGSNARSSGDVGQTIAKASAYHSLPSRRRAFRLAEGDEAAVQKYLGRVRQKKTSSQGFCANDDGIFSHHELSSLQNDEVLQPQRASMPSYKRPTSPFKLDTNENTCGDDSVFFVYP